MLQAFEVPRVVSTMDEGVPIGSVRSVLVIQAPKRPRSRDFIRNAADADDTLMRVHLPSGMLARRGARGVGDVLPVWTLRRPSDMPARRHSPRRSYRETLVVARGILELQDQKAAIERCDL